MKEQLELSPISLEDQDLLEGLLAKLREAQDLQFAEYSFTNAFLFRRQHNYQKVIGSDPLIIRGEFSPGNYYFIPTKRELGNLKENSIFKDVPIFPIPEGWLQDFEPFHPTVTACREDTDYLFHVEKLKYLAGRVLSSRRNLLHQFESKHDVESKEFTEKEIPDAQKVLEAWQVESGQEKDKTDYFVCCDAFTYLKRLKLFGRIVYAEGLPVGFALGQLLTAKTAVLHLLKTIHSYKGVTPFLYRDFANHLPSSIEWVNLEQDLGLQSLRQAKEAYDPDVFLPKYRVAVGSFTN